MNLVSKTVVVTLTVVGTLVWLAALVVAVLLLLPGAPPAPFLPDPSLPSTPPATGAGRRGAALPAVKTGPFFFTCPC